MATNLDIPPELIEEAQRVGEHRTKKEAVTAALHEYIRRRQQMHIFDLAGTIDFDPTYDYKAERRRDMVPLERPASGAPSRRRRRA